jgi:hypothetical protein
MSWALVFRIRQYLKGSLWALSYGLLRRIERRGAVEAEIAALDAVVRRTFQDPAERAFAARSDRQGIGGTTPPDDGSFHLVPGGPA